MQELQVPTRALTVEIFTDDGTHLAGSLFAPELPHRPSARETVNLVLNDERTFLPFLSTDGPVVVHKAHLLRVRVPPEPDLDPDPASPSLPGAEAPTECTLFLTDGSRVGGRLDLQTRWSSSRLVDKLNQAERFIALIGPEGVDFVQRDQVVRAT